MRHRRSPEVAASFLPLYGDAVPVPTGFTVSASPAGIRIGVPADLAFFAGHFPARPIVPGAALLQVVLQQLQVADGRGWTLHRVRFQQLVESGDDLTLRFLALAGGDTEFVLERAGRVVAQGSLHPEADAP